MTRTPPFLDDPDDTRAAIMRATYLALCEHGYANLTIQHIADEFDKSKSLLYHHYDGKDDLLLDFLDFMLERYEDRIPYPRDEREDEYLATILDRVLSSPLREGSREFTGAMVELRAQAAHDPEYRRHFTRSDQFVRKHLERILRAGIDREVFRDVDPAGTAAMLHSIVVGTTTQRVTTEDDLTDTVREEVDRYLRECVLAGSAEE